jgi:opacity protein-like surface antigen
MRSSKLISAVTVTLLSSTMAYASSNNGLNHSPTPMIEGSSIGKIHWVAALNIGAALAQPGKNQTIQTQTTTSNSYVNDGKLQTNLLAGAFVGIDFPLSPRFNYQLGLSYNYILPYSLNGQVKQLNQSQFTSFDYNYKVQSQQLYLESKLVLNATHHLHPYVSLGLGSAINNVYDFTPTDRDPTAVYPGIFANHSMAQFAYAVGLGADVDLAKHVRIGGGYRFANLGKAELGAASNFSYNKGLSTSLLTHELLINVIYIF